MIATVTCPACLRRVIAKDGRFMHHVGHNYKPCPRVGTEARQTHPIKGVQT